MVTLGMTVTTEKSLLFSGYPDLEGRGLEE
jgi:hypothetical protein